MKLFAIAVTFSISLIASVFFMIAYALNLSTQLQGLGLFVALGALGAGIVLWALYALPQRQTVNAIEDYPSDESDRAGAEETLNRGTGELERRSFIMRFFFGAIGALGLAALFPFRSLAPRFGRGLYHTKWTSGSRLVREDGTPVKVAELAVGSVVTVFPDGAAGDESSQTLLLRVPPGTIQATKGRADWAPRGYVAFSKVCTHAGCPVGLYRASSFELLCPCHQSVFDVVNEARPISGPASRALPQLPLAIDSEGYLRAQNDFSEPIGPGFWQRS
ncbi:MAG: Rieske (2Fe-2S) protein [Candidatus Eremiobacteraeota bacterium]|nr:Rieske (2Fe-2S) protein [Candidatus Eremiobacteraeota bacterium]